MVVRIHNVGKWSQLKPGALIELTKTMGRRVRLQVNCEVPTRFDVIEGERGTFLAVVEGLETIEFTAGADAYIGASPSTDSGEVWYFTNDGDQVAADRPEAVSFTKIASRRTRNPELEHMMFKMEQNMNRRIAALAQEMAQYQAPHDPETGEVTDEVSVGPVDGNPGTAEAAPAGAAEPAPTGQVASAKPAAGVPSGPTAAA